MTNMSLKSKSRSAKSGPPSFSFCLFLFVLFFEIVRVFEQFCFVFSVIFLVFGLLVSFHFHFAFMFCLCSCAPTSCFSLFLFVF